MLTLARLYLSENEPAKAVEVLEQASTYNPNHPAIHRMLVEALVRSGNEERAKELLPQILSRDPSFLEGRLTLARILADGGDRDAAIDLLRSAPKDEERDPDTEYLLASELYRRAAAGRDTRSAELEDLVEASELVDSILQAQPTHLRAQYLRALILAEQSRRDEAIAALRKLHEVAPQELRMQVTTELAELLEQEGRVSEAAALLAEMAEDLRAANGSALSSDRVWLEVARLHGRHRDWQALYEAAERLLRANEEELRREGMLLAGEALHQLGRSSEALQLLRRGEEQFDDDTRLRLKRAEILIATGDKAEADRLLTQLAEHADPTTLLALAQFHLEHQDQARMIPILKRLLEADRKEVEDGLRREIVFLLADSLTKTGKPREALKVLQSEQELFGCRRPRALPPPDQAGRGARGARSRRRGPPDSRPARRRQRPAGRAAAHAVLPGALALRGDDPRPASRHRHLGERPTGAPTSTWCSPWASPTNDWGASPRRKPPSSVLAIDPEDGLGTLNYLGYMWADRGEKLDQALELIQRAVALEPDNGAYVDSLGWAYFRLGRLSEARHHLEEAARLIPEDATILEHLGDLYVALEIPDKARELYRRALAMDDDNVEGLRRKLARLETGS